MDFRIFWDARRGGRLCPPGKICFRNAKPSPYLDGGSGIADRAGVPCGADAHTAVCDGCVSRFGSGCGRLIGICALRRAVGTAMRGLVANAGSSVLGVRRSLHQLIDGVAARGYCLSAECLDIKVSRHLCAATAAGDKHANSKNKKEFGRMKWKLQKRRISRQEHC